MEAPEKIYLYQSDREGKEYEDEWVYSPWGEGCVEYTRTDFVIKRAWEWLKENGGSYWMDDYDLPTDELVKDFINYMKGE